MIPARILLIEDNAHNRYLTSFLLETAGHQVLQAENGPEGLARAAAERPDLILIDIQLPGMDGHEVTRQIKTDPALRATPVVAVTSYAMAGDRERCLEAGAEGYIEKPINPDTFVEEVERFLRPSSATDPR